MKAGDKCPGCKLGLLERTEEGLACARCEYTLSIDELVAQLEEQKVKAGKYQFKPKKFSITIDNPEDGEVFLQGCILARQNSPSEYFPILIETLNDILQPWREARLAEELSNR